MDDVVTYISEMEIFLNGVKSNFINCGYTVFIDKWPEFHFVLSENQSIAFRNIAKDNLNCIIKKFECKANIDNQPNLGIIGATKINFYPSENTLVISGSFAVIQKFIPWFIDFSDSL